MPVYSAVIYISQSDKIQSGYFLQPAIIRPHVQYTKKFELIYHIEIRDGITNVQDFVRFLSKARFFKNCQHILQFTMVDFSVQFMKFPQILKRLHDSIVIIVELCHLAL